MDDQEKRQIIERALDSFLDELDWNAFGLETAKFYNALAEQAMAIDCEVEHTYDREGSYGTQFPLTIVKKGVWVLETFQGHQGTEGPYLFIGLPLPPKEDEA